MSTVVAKPLPGTEPDPRYPDSDGRFMGDTDFHNHAMREIAETLEYRYASVPDVYIASNLILYYEEGQPRKRRDPDVLFAKNVGKHMRRSFRVWEEKTLPSVLFEVASRKTWRIDVGVKRELYAQIGIKEYFIFDPEQRYIDPMLQGFRSVDGESVPIAPNPDDSLLSEEMGLILLVDEASLRFLDAKTEELLPTLWERAEQVDNKARQEIERNAALKAEVERLRAELARQKKK
jgi:Uma2 family endonuclease